MFPQIVVGFVCISLTQIQKALVIHIKCALGSMLSDYGPYGALLIHCI